MKIYAWRNRPPLSELLNLIQTQPKPLHLVVCLPDKRRPEWPLPNHAAADLCRLKTALIEAQACLQFNSINYLPNVLPDVHFWLAPPECADRLHEHFGTHPLCWQTEALPQRPAATLKPWLRPSENRHTRPERVLVIGAGIAGASTARLLAEHGIAVCVLEAGEIAAAASGNRQGLLYAKISPHNTEQTELLLTGYGYTRRLLQQSLPQAKSWGGGGVLHLNYNEAERRRNQALGGQSHHAHLYRSVSAAEAADLAGFPRQTAFSDGLYWPQGVWLNPPAWIHSLLDHPLIKVYPNTPLTAVSRQNNMWHAATPTGHFSAGHIIYCTGAASPISPEANVAALPFRQIRGQTGVANATPFSQQLRCALSAEGYISPSWQGRHCYGATFILNSSDSRWLEQDEAANRATLAALNPELAADLFAHHPPAAAEGHAAVRCDSPDHLPTVGPIADAAALQTAYAKLALDKNYRLDTPCPYLPNAYINTAHGTRGLTTAPICAAALVAEILNLPNPLSQRLRTALHPNRHLIRAIIKGQR
ncbi:FAD-dependent 5-carboxymethylaminomethyl-2-thiouridine(34) oxidoreductase MnmC [Neisseria sp. ZJ106]|uniref:FAD-dependent 5-carboxymethylaminomethyl-2-thiouridine(34) oxidoreductase MnmC n=1 Tax=Neisseria lisongii TaxID=2912188 RepID=A0ABY7RQ68_9NEIS|nr:FAD-dependent 5-carboxymethylaminomethyl-2-thiouridine(34) oxidoreductase MnmC [Neisseria lisongii]MCF7521347.1 FAD-dependent 5-carboxymethylaminomethyl-2-thiouridine(34) oxidoreductase MnmC [Neisseria lisongii]WCL72395.1 FAD-dependent 5-carboxymethylaminomethyl-2-thiouridine(34) oxidoreductase MnmC [Neisseria lisongii]